MIQMANNYKRQPVEKYIIKALQSLGGSASRKAIKDEIVADESIDISYEDVFEPIKSKKGTSYIPFTMDFNFGLVNLHTCDCIQDYGRGGDITLTEAGRTIDFLTFPTDEDKQKIDSYWEKKAQEREEKKSQTQEDLNEKNKSDEQSSSSAEETPEETDISEDWKVTVLERIKQFSPKKFESFSRLLLSHMGIKFDREKGVKMSGDHGIDGFGYFESDEFRTAKVVVQCKKFVDCPVSEPDIDKFKGVMMSFNADYGIFITTSFFTKQAQVKAVQGGKTVTLIDGQRLVDLIEKYQLHITPVQTYELNDYYFQKD